MVNFAVHPVTPQGTSTPGQAATAIAVIPARYRSSRLPGKPLADIAGRPMVEHVYRRAQAASSLAAVLVATDDVRIRDAVLAFGGDVRMTAAGHGSGTERLAEAVRDLRCDIVVNVQGDEPLVEPAAIDLAVEALREAPDAPMSTACCELNGDAELADPNVVKVVVDGDGYALYFSRAAIPHRRVGGAVPRGVYKHVGLYAYRRNFLLHIAALEPTPLEQAEQLEQLRVLEHGYRVRTVPVPGAPVGVDTPEDLERVRCLLANGA